MTDALHQLADDRAEFSARIDGLDDRAMAWRPSPAEWSLALVLEHLVRVEGGSLRVLEKQAAKGDAFRDLGPPSDEGLAAVVAGLRSGHRFRIPPAAAPAITPTGEMPLDALRQAWDGFDARWRALDATLTDRQRAAGLFLHVRAGALRPDGVARFVAAHTAHHRAQAERIRAADGFPG